MRVRIARDQRRRIPELSQTIKALEAEIAQLVARIAPQRLSEPGFGPLTAAKLVGEIAGADRFATDAKLARATGIAPIPVSSANTNRHRLDHGGNRQINATIHRIAVTRLRCHPETTSPATAPKAKAPKKPSAASNATSPAASGTPHKPPRPQQDTPTHQVLDKGAATAALSPRSRGLACARATAGSVVCAGVGQSVSGRSAVPVEAHDRCIVFGRAIGGVE
jgi:hypothetical protein